MGKYMRKCSRGIGEVVVMEVTEVVGVRTRARALALGAAAAGDPGKADCDVGQKRRKVEGGTMRSAPLMPSEAEIEEFFSAAEKREWQRFSQKYNYDVVKDVPLEGRYEWVQIKP